MLSQDDLDKPCAAMLLQELTELVPYVQWQADGTCAGFNWFVHAAILA